MRLGRFPHARLILWFGIFIISCLVPVQAQLQLDADQTPIPNHAPIPLTSNWHYRWDTLPEFPEGVELPQWNELEDWQSIDLPQKVRVEPDQEVLWLAVALPEVRLRFPALYFRGIPHILEAYINGEQVYLFDELKPDGTLKEKEGEFPIINLQPTHHAQILLIRVYVGNNRIAVGNDPSILLGFGHQPLYGSQPDLFRRLIFNDGVRFVLGFLFIVCGFFPLLITLFKRTDPIYSSFAFVTFLLGIYTITPAQLIRLLFNYSLLWTFIHHITFHLLPVSLSLFFEHVFGAGPKKIIRRLRYVHLIYAPLAIILASTPLLSWGTVALPTQIGSLFTASILIVLATWRAIKGDPEAKIISFGFSIFLICAMHDIVMYIYPISSWVTVQFYPWGMLFFLICLAFIVERRFTEAQNHLKAYAKASDRFVPHEFLQFLGKTSIIDVKLGDQVQKEMTVLFSDIRSFTSISESMPPEQNFNFLNAYLRAVSPVIRQYNGFIDKYIGDAVMALFPHSVEDAIWAAVSMQKALHQFNQTVREEGYPAINIGIGLHRGTLMLGTIGEQQRMETTVIADAVNLASRLEDSTKRYGASLVISQSTLNQLKHPEQFSSRYLGTILVKGKKEPIKICEIYESDAAHIRELKTETKDDFEAAIDLYDQGKLEAAAQLFQAVCTANPEDAVARLCLLRCKHL
jgi:class 3 adenylate cyclase